MLLSAKRKSKEKETLKYCLLCFDLYTASQDGNEEAALEDFKAAAGLGSGYAKSMLVEMNPYAAMCNAMLRYNQGFRMDFLVNIILSMVRSFM
jgi:hypothetical protein